MRRTLIAKVRANSFSILISGVVSGTRQPWRVRFVHLFVRRGGLSTSVGEHSGRIQSIQQFIWYHFDSQRAFWRRRLGLGAFSAVPDSIW